MSEHSGCVPQLDPSREGEGVALLRSGAPPPAPLSPPSLDVAARDWGPRVSNKSRAPPRSRKQSKMQPQKGAGAGAPTGLEVEGGEVEGQVCPCLWPGPDPQGPFPPEPPILLAIPLLELLAAWAPGGSEPVLDQKPCRTLEMRR